MQRIYLLLNAFTYLKELFRANSHAISTSCHALPCCFVLYLYMYIAALSMALFMALVQIKVANCFPNVICFKLYKAIYIFKLPNFHQLKQSDNINKYVTQTLI